MLAIRLPAEIEKRLDSLARMTKRTKSFYVREAILRHLEDIEDIFTAEAVLLRREKTYTLEEVEAELDLASQASRNRKKPARKTRSGRTKANSKNAARKVSRSA
jgi:RHH-type rel operon transcriptional repressor/antitoxin RelB